MDELELLKKDWQKKENEFPKVSHEAIYAMLLKKSSSSIKWIFYISMLELAFGIILTLLYHPSFEKEFNLPKWLDYLPYFSMLIIVYFIIQFYNNYKRVTTTSSIKGLLESIFKARKSVRQYVVINLVFGGLLMIFVALFVTISQFGGWDKFIAEITFKQLAVMSALIIILTAVMIGFFLGIYYLLYGILTKRLKRNYNELKKMEV
ncbi:hypothetical protein [Joostella sp. CR20]|uniref:hypothetical protein n=1 Tax=Joostella sp. CR20 TaxID=2804312 RepID=UPI00313E4AD9